jgi:hypothetical protein
MVLARRFRRHDVARPRLLQPDGPFDLAWFDLILKVALTKPRVDAIAAKLARGAAESTVWPGVVALH